MNTRDEINKDIQKVFKDIDEHILRMRNLLII